VQPVLLSESKNPHPINCASANLQLANRDGTNLQSRNAASEKSAPLVEIVERHADRKYAALELSIRRERRREFILRDAVIIHPVVHQFDTTEL